MYEQEVEIKFKLLRIYMVMVNKSILLTNLAAPSSRPPSSMESRPVPAVSVCAEVGDEDAAGELGGPGWGSRWRRWRQIPSRRQTWASWGKT